jgi:hypothetical protein
VDASPRTGRDAPTPRVLLCCGVDYTPTLRVSADLLDLAAAPSRGPLLWVTGREVSSRPDLPPSPAQHTGSGRGQDPTCSRHPKTKGTCPGPGGLCLLEESAGSFREVQQTWGPPPLPVTCLGGRTRGEDHACAPPSLARGEFGRGSGPNHGGASSPRVRSTGTGSSFPGCPFGQRRLR